MSSCCKKEAAAKTVKGTIDGETYSLCPVCMQVLPARRVRRAGGIFLERRCEEHGAFSTPVWRGRLDFDAWMSAARAPAWPARPLCPGACADGAGICGSHMAGTCCVVLEVTGRCNLSCEYCFADPAGGEDLSPEQIAGQIASFVEPGVTLLQLSGGEPTLRDDLPEIVRTAKSLGCKYVQLNTNGIRLAGDAPYAAALADAGLSFVFLQFDGMDDDVYRRLRGESLFAAKDRAVTICGDAGLGVILVPTIVRGVNEEHLGALLEYAVSRSPVVRGLHLQPVGHLGRIPRAPACGDRFTLDELAGELISRSNGMLAARDIRPSCCDHPLCGFHGDFVVTDGGRLYSLAGAPEGGCCKAEIGIEKDEAAAKNREFVGRRWSRERGDEAPVSPGGIGDLDGFLYHARERRFTITAMAFQDAGHLDLERLRSCSLHVFADGGLRPFCAHYACR